MARWHPSPSTASCRPGATDVKLPPVGSHVKVQWQDSEYLEGWRTVASLTHWTESPVFTYGRFVAATPCNIIIASTIGDSSDPDDLRALNPLRIPRKAIERILVLDTDWPDE